MAQQLDILLQELLKRGVKTTRIKLEASLKNKFEGDPKTKELVLSIMKELKNPKEEKLTKKEEPPKKPQTTKKKVKKTITTEENLPENIQENLFEKVINFEFPVKKADVSFCESKSNSWNCNLSALNMNVDFSATEAEKEAIRLAKKVVVRVEVIPQFNKEKK